jgi:hypothetical protein
MKKSNKSRRNLQGKPGMRATVIGVQADREDPGTPQVLSKIDFSARQLSLPGIESGADDGGDTSNGRRIPLHLRLLPMAGPNS